MSSLVQHRLGAPISVQYVKGENKSAITGIYQMSALCVPYNDLGAKKAMTGETKPRPAHEGPGAPLLMLHVVASVLNSHSHHGNRYS